MTQSKYNHQSDAATTIPNSAAAILGASRGSPRTDPDGDNRLSQGGDHDQPCRSTKWTSERRHPPSMPHLRTELVNGQRGCPQSEVCRPVEETGAYQQ
jgi:hypothetical protein